MEKRTRRWRILTFVGLFGMILGLLDPLEGSVVILAGSGLIALGAWIGRSRSRKLLYLAFAFIVVGVGVMFLLSAKGGIGGPTGRSSWWALLIVPYPVGWILGLIGAIRDLKGASKKPI